MPTAHTARVSRDLAEFLPDARPIGVTVDDGIVQLTGHVPTYADKGNAERIVKRVHGVQGLANDLEVRLATSAERDDVDITRSAIIALGWNVGVPKERIRVSASRGWVTLEGNVEWYYEVTAKHAPVEDVKGKIEAACGGTRRSMPRRSPCRPMTAARSSPARCARGWSATTP